MGLGGRGLRRRMGEIPPNPPKKEGNGGAGEYRGEDLLGVLGGDRVPIVGGDGVRAIRPKSTGERPTPVGVEERGIPVAVLGRGGVPQTRESKYTPL